MTTGILTETFAYGHAAAASWRVAAEACLAQCGLGVRTATLGFVYATDSFADSFSEIVDFLRRRTGIPHWVGTVGLGICATGREYLDEPALAIMCCSFDDSAFRVLPVLQSPREVAQARLEWGNHARQLRGAACRSVEPLAVVAAARAGGAHGEWVRGGRADQLARPRHSVRRRAVRRADCPGVVFSEEVVIATRLTQGCSPIGPRHRVSAARHNVLMELDGRPALEVLREDIGPEMSGTSLPAVGGTIFAGLPIEGSDTGDYVVRNLVGIDPVHKFVAIGEAVRPGGQVLFCKRDRGTASDDLDRMLASIRTGLYRPPRGALYFSCLGRGAALFGDDSQELRMIRDGLGDVPLVGFFCNGEISHNRLYGYTGVLTLFL